MSLKKPAQVLLMSALLGIPAAWNLTARAAAPSPAPVLLDADDKYIGPLREDRKKLEEVKEDLKSEAYDPRGHRHLAMDSIEKAIKDISDEIDEYKKDHK